MPLRTALTTVAVFAGFAWATSAPAQSETADNAEFRVENRVFVENEKEPHSESTTIFYRGIVYDYLKRPSEVTVFDKARGRFILLDSARRVQTEVSEEKVVAFTDALRRWAVSQSDPFVQFLAAPKFEEQFDESTQKLVFRSPWMTYRVTTVDVQNEAISRKYHEFSDWHCRLNTLLTPGARPPFPRMAVNGALQKRHQIPNEAELVLRLKKGASSKRLTIRSEHQLVARLVESDRDRVAQTDQFMAMFRQVTFDEYQEKIGN